MLIFPKHCLLQGGKRIVFSKVNVLLLAGLNLSKWHYFQTWERPHTLQCSGANQAVCTDRKWAASFAATWTRWRTLVRKGWVLQATVCISGHVQGRTQGPTRGGGAGLMSRDPTPSDATFMCPQLPELLLNMFLQKWWFWNFSNLTNYVISTRKQFLLGKKNRCIKNSVIKVVKCQKQLRQ